MATQSPTSGFWLSAKKKQRKPLSRELINRRLVYAMFSLALVVLVMVSIATWLGMEPVAQPKASPIIRSHTVTITADGNYLHIVDDKGRVLLDGNGGFIAVVNDGLERARLLAGVADNPAVTITQHENGRISLYDPASEWRMEISSFGRGNAETFLKILNAN